MDSLLRIIKKLIPKKVFSFFQPGYHYTLALIAAIRYRYPSRSLNVVAITGTKGKTSTAEFVNAMLEAAGKKTALLGTLRFKIGDVSHPNLYKMSVPGRSFVQKFLRDAVTAGCEYAVLEMTSEAVKQYRHKFIDFNTLIFTNISPEHIESHGSFEKYLAAKLELAKAVETSKKQERMIVANADDKESEKFLAVNVPQKLTFKLEDAKPFTLTDFDSEFTYKSEQMKTYLPGKFNLYNIVAAATYAQTQGVSIKKIKQAVENLREIRGRVQKIEMGQKFMVIVDYAHTADSLKNLYEAFPNRRKIGVLGNTGGGRDTWKRPEMAKVADTYCSEIILTDEDPYDDDPRAIVEDMRKAITKHPVEVIMDRRQAIAAAFKKAQAGDAVLITGKGTDPYIMRAKGVKEPWSDAKVAEEEIKKILR